MIFQLLRFACSISKPTSDRLTKCTRLFCRNAFTSRSSTCGELTSRQVDSVVTLCGWVEKKRMDKFLILRDTYGCVQVVLNRRLFDLVKHLPLNSVVRVKGVVTSRPSREINSEMATGQVEVVADELEILNRSKAVLPINTGDKLLPNDNLRLRYRYLDLRRSSLQANLRLRARLVSSMRKLLEDKYAFVEVETPTLFCRTPGGANEFLVPSRQANRFFCLPQSPQQYKQLLMVAGFDRYYQIARCYRDEGSKSDRQPEFTQVDLEMSFADEEGVIGLVESMLEHSWPEDVHRKLQTPFPRMQYSDSIRMYGVDKPDTRFDWPLISLDHLSKEYDHCSAFVPHSLDGQPLPMPSIEEVAAWRKHLAIYHQHVAVNFEIFGPDAVSQIQSDNASGDFLVLASSNSPGRTAHTLGLLRNMLADHYEKNYNLPIRRDEYNFLWIVNFPLFLRNASGNLESAHHPFTAPVEGQEELLYKCPDKVTGRHYDLVLNGVELGGGSVRIHQADMQRYVLETVLKEPVEPLKHMLDALDSGAPPHAGFALGLDRYVALLTKSSSIREVIAFPKSHDCREPMTGAPTVVDKATLERYFIEVTAKKSVPLAEEVN